MISIISYSLRAKNVPNFYLIQLYVLFLMVSGIGLGITLVGCKMEIKGRMFSKSVVSVI
jgi:hypothetical protein